MSKKTLYIDFDKGNFIDGDGAIITQPPTISLMAAPDWELRFVRQINGTLQPVDLSEAVSYTAAIDNDFLSGTQPMVRTLDTDIDHSGATSGVIIVSLDASTETFFEKVDGKNSIPAFFEIRGLDSSDKVIYDYRFRVNCFGSVDPIGGEPLPVVSGGCTISDVYALLRSSVSFQFSENGTSWHDTQTQSDAYYRQSYPGGDWSDAIMLHNGQDGLNAPNVLFKYSADNSSYHDTPVAADCYFKTSNDNGVTWTSGLLFRNATVDAANVAGLNQAVVNVTSGLYYTKDAVSGFLDEKADKSTVFNLGEVAGSLTYDFADGDYQMCSLGGDTTLAELSGFSIGDAGALQISKNLGSKFYYNGIELLAQSDEGDFMVGLVCIGANTVKVSSPTVLY